MLRVRSFCIFSLSNIICIKDLLKRSLISYSVAKSLWEFQPLGWFVTRGGPLRTLRPYLTLSPILFRFLALYRPGLRDWGTVNGTQTGISNIHSNLLFQNLRKIDISSSLSCNPATGRLHSALSPTW